MSKPNKYQKQLSEAVEATRNELLGELKIAQAARTTALSTREHAAHDKWSAYKEMGRNEHVLAVASRIEEMAARTQLLAGNLTIFANDSHTDSEEAQAAMAEAAAAIKNAAGAMELLTEAVHAEAAVTKFRDKGDDVNDDALVANAAVEKATTAVSHLQTQSLKCSIIAATPLAGSVAQSFSVLGDQVANLVTDTTQARDMARQEVAATTTLRNQTWKRFYKTIEPFERPLQVKNGLLRSFEEIDKLANFGLKVQPSNQLPLAGSRSSVDQQGLAAGLLAQVALPAETADFYKAPVFYAVNELDAATFNFAQSSVGFDPTTQPQPAPAGGRGVWKRLSPQIAPDTTSSSTSEVIPGTVQALVAQAGEGTQKVTDLVTAAVEQTAAAVAADQAAVDSQMKAVEKARADLAAVQAEEKTKADALAAAQQKEAAAAAAVEGLRGSSEEKKAKNLPKALETLAAAEAETATAAEALTVVQGLSTLAAAELASAEKIIAQKTHALVADGAGRWQAALSALSRTQAAFETTSKNTVEAKTAAETARNAEQTALDAAGKAAEASKALSASTGSPGELESALSAAELASNSAAAAAEKAGLAAAKAIGLMAQAAEKAETAAKEAGKEVGLASAATTSTTGPAGLSEASQEMESAFASVSHLTQQINTAAQAEKQLEAEVRAGIYQAQLLQDNKGAALKLGTSYCIFMKQDLKERVPESPLAQLPRFSLPSQPILATYSLQEPLKPKVLRLLSGLPAGPADPLLVAFTLPVPPPKGVQHRMIIIPSKLWQTVQEDEQYLIERASPSDYVKLNFMCLSKLSADGTHDKRIQEIQDSILGQFKTDIESLLPTGDQKAPLENATVQVAALLKELSDTPQLSSTALVYYSCVPSTAKPTGATFGHYSDMSGDVITLNSDCYQVGVLAWQDNPDGPYVGSLVGQSESIGTPPPDFYGSGPADDPATPAPAATTPAA